MDCYLIYSACSKSNTSREKSRHVYTKTLTMMTLKQEEKLIDRLKGLTELELTALFDELRDHFRREKLSHVFEGVSDSSDLQHQVWDLEDKIDRLESKLREINDLSEL
jgi:hypothetical protein